jgi:hypothetical protein
MIAKYSPTVSVWYKKDQEWWKKNGGSSHLDKDGFDSYGYDSKGTDRAGNEERDYSLPGTGEALYNEVLMKYYRIKQPVRHAHH